MPVLNSSRPTARRQWQCAAMQQKVRKSLSPYVVGLVLQYYLLFSSLSPL